MKIGNLQSLPWYLRLVMFVAVAGVMYGGSGTSLPADSRRNKDASTTRSRELLPKNAQAQIASQRLNEFRAVYKAREEEYEELKALLPEQRELTMVLQGVQDRARSNGLVLAEIHSQGRCSAGQLQRQEDRSQRHEFFCFAARLLRAAGPLSANRFHHQLRTEAAGQAVVIEDRRCDV